MFSLPLETATIIRATLPEVVARQSTLMLRMWHHLPSDLAHDLLFVTGSTSAGMTVVEALLEAVRRQAAGGNRTDYTAPRAMLAAHCDQREALTRAFVAALRDALGARATEMVVHAWGRLIDGFITECCLPPAEPEPAPKLD